MRIIIIFLVCVCVCVPVLVREWERARVLPTERYITYNHLQSVLRARVCVCQCHYYIIIFRRTKNKEEKKPKFLYITTRHDEAIHVFAFIVATLVRFSSKSFSIFASRLLCFFAKFHFWWCERRAASLNRIYF